MKLRLLDVVDSENAGLPLCLMFSLGPFYHWLASLQDIVIVQREKVTGDVNNNLGWCRPREPTAFVPPSLLWCTPDMKLNLIGFKLR